MGPILCLTNRTTTAPEPEDATDEELAQEIYDTELEKRRWAKICIEIVRNRSHGSDPSGRVQLANDLVQIAACERLRRILGSDQPS